MSGRSILQAWLQNAAKAKLRDAVVQTVREPPVEGEPATKGEEPRACDVGVVFALAIEAGCFEDLLQGVVSIRSDSFVIREGGFGGFRVAIILSGAGCPNAARATEVLIDGHRPRRVISAGLAGALSPELERNDIIVADRLLLASDLDPPLGVTEGGSVECGSVRKSSNRELSLELSGSLLAALVRPGVRRGMLLTADRVVREPRERQALFVRYGALAIDMETFAVADVCLRRQVPFDSIRVISDAAVETLPADVGHILRQKSIAGQLGAAVGAVWRRPASAMDMYQLRERALVASDRLARFLVDCSFGEEA
jgi:adenosylhomocysteine nucleosidase